MVKPDPTDKLFDELVAGKTREELLGKDGILKQLTKRVVEHALEGEMTHHLGYEPHAPEGKNTGNSRNGKTTKTMIGETGEIEIVVPRDRAGTFEPALIPKHHRRFPEFDDKVIALYARGMTTREIQGHLRELYGTDISPQLISAVTDSVMEDVAACITGRGSCPTTARRTSRRISKRTWSSTTSAMCAADRTTRRRRARSSATTAR
jgi:transposase-like protein